MPDNSTRRTYLKGISGAFLLTTLAGCLNRSVAKYSEQTTRPQEGLGCPSRDESTLYCSVSDNMNELNVDLNSSKESVTLPRDRIKFTIHNKSRKDFYFNPYGWHLHKAAERDWHHITPLSWPQPLDPLSPDENHNWDATIDNTNLDQIPPGPTSSSEFTVEGLGGGTYSFYISGWFTSGQSNEIGLAKNFEINGEELTLKPTSSVVETERRDSTVTVYAENPDRDGGEQIEYVVTKKTDISTGEKHLLTEQVLQYPILRNTLSYFESGVEQVRLVQKDGTAPIFGHREDFRLIEYNGTTYEVDY